MSKVGWPRVKLGVVVLIALSAVARAHAASDDVTSSGTGFFVNDAGWLVTNAHVVTGCKTMSAPDLGDADHVLIDQQNDLAALHFPAAAAKPHLPLRERQPRLGEDIAAFGYPLTGLLSDSIKVTTGNINSLVGLDNDTRYLQVSTPLQPGNSGGPVVDRFGSVVGVSSAVLGAAFTQATGIAPQNVNFAIRSNVVELFLQTRQVAFDLANPEPGDPEISTADLSEKVVPSVVPVLCRGGETSQVTASNAVPPSAAAPAPVPASVPSQSEGEESEGELEAAVVRLVRGLIETDGGNAQSSLNAVASVYAEAVNYYGKVRSLEEVLADKRAYFQRWPERTYRIRSETITANCFSDRCTVSGIYDWAVRSLARRRQAQGAANFSYTIALGNSPRIIAETGGVLK